MRCCAREYSQLMPEYCQEEDAFMRGGIKKIGKRLKHKEPQVSGNCYILFSFTAKPVRYST